MKALDPDVTAALQAAPDQGLTLRRAIYIVARNAAGTATAEFGFWNDLDTVNMSVRRADTGATVARQFVGDGSLISVPEIPNVSDGTISSIQIALSPLHATVRNMLGGYDVRTAKLEVYDIFLHPRTHALLGTPSPVFYGIINKATPTRSAVGGESTLTLEVASHARELTRTNPAKKSDETQKLRSGDRFRRHVGVANVKVWWGEKKQRPNSGN